ncbi:hypothetical protein H4R18_005359 [Coemansia javaensis]|uniref:Histidine phosphatase family protein n=1 Tax=Coemansia javaensis TaxID=2761396 RepID=A0A9W8LEY1_9FUNG|nr:hypothetical protein H4R18_005359 [Coemansia javaensis]
MAPLEIILARHGQTAANAEGRLQGSGLNPPLNERGERQAAALGAALKDGRLDWIVASAMERAIQTADAVAKHHAEAARHSDARLNEISWGELDGVKFGEARPRLSAVVQRWTTGDFDARVAGGESANDGKARVLAAFADILRTARERQYRRIILCIHGRIMRVMMAALVDKDLGKMDKYTHTNCCYNVIRAEVDDSAPGTDPDEVDFVPVRLDVRDHLAAVRAD